MKTLLMTVTLSVFFVINVYSDPIDGLDYYSESAATSSRITAAVFNPAGLGFWGSMGMRYDHQFTDSSYKGNDAFMLSSRGLMLGVEWLRHTSSIFRRKYTAAIGDRIAQNFYAGLAYSWFGGSNDDYNKMKSWKIGLLYHPRPFLALGLIADRLNEPKFNGIKQKRFYQPGIALRPFGEKVTLSSDLRWLEADDLSDLQASFRIEVSPLKGFWLNCDYRTEGEIRLGIAASFEQSRSGLQINFNRRQKYSGGSYFIEVGPSGDSDAMFSRKRIGILKLNRAIIEEPRGGFPFKAKNYSFLDIISAIDRASSDNRIDGLIVKIDGIKLNFAITQELREAFGDFRQTGKKIITYMDNGTNLSYYLAAASDSIYMNPVGILELNGIAATATFYKGTMDKLGVRAQIVNTGKHKTYGDAFTDTSLTIEAKEQLDWLLDGLYSQLVEGISSGRQMMGESIKQIIENGPYTNKEAQALALIDGLKHYDEITNNPQTEIFSNYVELTNLYKTEAYNPRWSEPKNIALIYADGAITQGNNGTNLLDGKTIGSSTIAKAIRQIRNDNSIAGVVLRVNSPGGDVFASEEIYRELELLKGKKPLIVSMGSAAASGGYYIACIGDQIFCSPGTITGSIGVVAGKADLSGLHNKIGLRYEIVKRGEHSDIRSSTRPASDAEISRISEMVWQFYEDFVYRVSTWRKIEHDSVDAIGQGKVWTGQQALRNGLVDSYGGIWTAIETCRQKANIDPADDIRIKIYPKYGFSFPSRMSLAGLKSELEEFIEVAEGPIYSFRMPLDINIH